MLCCSPPLRRSQPFIKHINRCEPTTWTTWPSQHSRCWHSPQAKGLPAACICTCTCASAQHLPQHACTIVLQYMSCMHVHVNYTCSIPAASSEWPDATHVCYTAYAAQRAAAMGSQLCYQCKVHRYTCRSVHATATAQ